MKEESLIFLILRILVGIVFIIHGLNKTKTLDSWHQFLSGKNATFGYSFSSLCAYIEIIIGFLVLFGLFTRFSALVGLIFMCIAIYIAHFDDPVKTYVYQISLILIFLSIVIYGGGDYSLDYFFKDIRKKI